MGKLVALISLLTVFLAARPALAQEFGQYDAESYPKKMVKRPLLLAPSMFEVRFGGATNMFAGAPFDAEDRFRSRIDFRYAVGTRFQFGADSDLDAFPTDEFQVRNLSAWAEYNLVPTISARAGAYMVALRDGDFGAEFGVRASVPMKFRMGDNAALVANANISILDGDSILATPVGMQLNVMEALVIQVDTGVETTNFEFKDNDTEDTWNLPLSIGATLSLTRKIDITAQFRYTDIANETKDRWVFAFFAFRG